MAGMALGLGNGLAFSRGSAGGGAPAQTNKLLFSDGLAQRTMVPAVAINGITYVSTVSGTATRGNVELTQLGATNTRPRHKLIRAQNEFGKGGDQTDDHGAQPAIQMTSGHIFRCHCEHKDAAGWRYSVTFNVHTSDGLAFERFRQEAIIPIPATFTECSYATVEVGFSTGEVLILARAENATVSSWFLLRATEAAILAGTPASPTVWTQTELIRGTVANRPYAWMSNKDPVNADTAAIYIVKATSSASGLYYQRLTRSAGNWVLQSYSGTNQTLPIDPATIFTGRDVITNQTATQTFLAEHGVIGADGRFRLLASEAPTGFGVAGLQTDLQYVHFYDNGTTWAKTVIVAGQNSLPDANTQMGSGGLDWTNPARVVLSVGAVGQTKEIQVWTVNEGASTASKTQDITTGSTNHQIRPWYVRNGSTALSMIWFDRISMPNFNNYEINVWGRGTNSYVQYGAARGSYNARTTAYVATLNTALSTAEKDRLDDWFIDTSSGRLDAGRDHYADAKIIYNYSTNAANNLTVPIKNGAGALTAAGTLTFAAGKGFNGAGNQVDYISETTNWNAISGLTATSVVVIAMHQCAAATSNTSVSYASAGDSTTLVLSANSAPNRLCQGGDVTLSGQRWSVCTVSLRDATGQRVFINDYQVGTNATAPSALPSTPRILGSGTTVKQHALWVLPYRNDNQIVDIEMAEYQHKRANGGYVF